MNQVNGSKNISGIQNYNYVLHAATTFSANDIKYFIAAFERVAKIKKIAVHCPLISFLSSRVVTV